jgi:putative protein kinase ArgK-like GTPase of G3E family
MRPELLDPVADLVAPLLTSRRVMVGIVGAPGAGKSTLAAALGGQLRTAAGAGRYRACGSA